MSWHTVTRRFADTGLIPAYTTGGVRVTVDYVGAASPRWSARQWFARAHDTTRTQ
jgi:hypothetical protein